MTTVHRAYCRVHPYIAFPMRPDHLDAEEDRISHAHTPGGHHIGVDELDVDQVDDELHGFPEHGYVRALLAECNAMLDVARRGPDPKTGVSGSGGEASGSPTVSA